MSCSGPYSNASGRWSNATGAPNHVPQPTSDFSDILVDGFTYPDSIPPQTYLVRLLYYCNDFSEVTEGYLAHVPGTAQKGG